MYRNHSRRRDLDVHLGLAHQSGRLVRVCDAGGGGAFRAWRWHLRRHGFGDGRNGGDCCGGRGQGRAGPFARGSCGLMGYSSTTALFDGAMEGIHARAGLRLAVVRSCILVRRRPGFDALRRRVPFRLCSTGVFHRAQSAAHPLL